MMAELLTSCGLVTASGGWTLAACQARRLARRLRTDALTGLANREALRHRFRRSGPGPVGLLMLDLNEFKPINDQYGHRTGDAVLVEVAQRLHHLAGTGELAVRLHGDEFVLWLGEFNDPVRDALHVEQRTRDVATALAEPAPIGQQRLTISASVGATLQPAPDQVEDLLAVADTAMLRTKPAGAGRHQHRRLEKASA